MSPLVCKVLDLVSAGLYSLEAILLEGERDMAKKARKKLGAAKAITPRKPLINTISHVPLPRLAANHNELTLKA